MDAWRKEGFILYSEEIEAFPEEYSTPELYQPTHRRREDEMSEMAMKSPKVDSVLNQNYQYLTDNIERLFNQVENLEQRLKVILTDAEPETQRDSMGYGGNTALSENLAQLCRRTQDLTERLSYLTARIDL
jgi:predicted RNase H-like nuclease (RuvC/YqgF family)